MPDYDFQILQPNEFECLTRNLLQKREKIYIESFTPAARLRLGRGVKCLTHS